MDYKKIRLNNECSTHVVKRLNRLSTWKFFTVLYRDNMFRLLGYSLLMLLCFVPMFAVQFLSAQNLASIKQSLPTLNGFGFSTGVWQDVQEFYLSQVSVNNLIYGLYTVSAAALLCLVLSGGFAVIRDAFWTGKLSTVGVFKSIWMGISANIGYAFASVAIIAFCVFGVFQFYAWAATVMAVWLAIVLTVVISIAVLLVACYLLILCSVSVTYKQTVAENLDDAWRLLWLNILPNVLHLLIALLPIPLYFLFAGGMLQMIFMALIMLLGGMYFPLVWQTHMMKTFALFHPVEAKKKKEVRKEEEARIAAEQERQRQLAAEKQARKDAKKAARTK